MTVEVKEILKIPADPGVINDTDKLSITFVYNNSEYRIMLPWQDFTTKTQLKSILQTAITKVKMKQPIINLTDKWKGLHSI